MKNVWRKLKIRSYTNQGSDNDACSPALDIIGINRYGSWYSDTGMLQVIEKQLSNDLLGWREKYPDKPIMILEYGADTISGKFIRQRKKVA